MLFDDYFNTLWDDNNNLLCDKKRRVNELVRYMLDRTQQIFVWEGLPETIPAHEIEFMLQAFGNVCVTEVNETPSDKIPTGLYAFYGGLGGVLDAYYNPTLYTIANPYLNFTRQLEIGRECVRVRNDKLGIGLVPMFIKYATMQNENEISMNMLSILYRVSQLVSADDDRTFESAKAYLNDIVAGKFGVISSSEFFDGLQVDKSETRQSIKDLIEYEQYIKATWYNEIGLNSNYNMKRERIASTEAQLNDDSLIPLVENMLTWRQNAITEIQNMYGDRYDLFGLRVSLNYIWDLDNMFMSIPKETATGEPETETGTDEPETETGTDEPETGADEPETETGTEEPETGTEEPETGTEENPDVNVEINVEINNDGETEESEVKENEYNPDDETDA